MNIDDRTSCRSVPDAMQITGPADLLQAVPYLLGFHPASSLVIVGLDAGVLVVTVRMDLVDLAEPLVLGDAVEAMHRGGASELIGVVFDDCPVDPRGGLPWQGAAERLRDEAGRVGCTVIDTLFVGARRWWSYSCIDVTCCPPEGRSFDETTTAFAAAATYAGMVALPDRSALADVLLPSPAAERDRLGFLIAEHENASVQAVLDGRKARYDRSTKRALFAAARVADAAVGSADTEIVSDDDAARFGVDLSAHPLRDSVWMAVDEGRLDGRRLWAELARRLPSPYDAAPLFLYGWCSWRAGNGALAGIAAERAVASDPGYSAADLLLAALSRGLDPRRLPRLRRPTPKR